ncbi:MAG: hypothetical protein LQ341_004590, partial [Variospora aurantia]
SNATTTTATATTTRLKKQKEKTISGAHGEVTSRMAPLPFAVVPARLPPSWASPSEDKT